MAPETPVDLVVVNLTMVNNSEAKVEGFERSEKARETGDRIGVLWSANAAPRGFSAAGDGVVYVSPNATPPLTYDATPDVIKGGYEWVYNTQSDLMMVLVFPAGYVPTKFEPYPARAKVFKGDRVAAYWLFDERSRAEVRWTMKKHEGDISRHVREMALETALLQIQSRRGMLIASVADA